MKTSITSFGNSKGIRIPKPLLEESGLSDEVEITAKKNEIKITPARSMKKLQINEEYIMSLAVLQDWNSAEEDRAWAHLQ